LVCGLVFPHGGKKLRRPKNGVHNLKRGGGTRGEREYVQKRKLGEEDFEVKEMKEEV